MEVIDEIKLVGVLALGGLDPLPGGFPWGSQAELRHLKGANIYMVIQ